MMNDFLMGQNILGQNVIDSEEAYRMTPPVCDPDVTPEVLAEAIRNVRAEEDMRIPICKPEFKDFRQLVRELEQEGGD